MNNKPVLLLLLASFSWASCSDKLDIAKLRGSYKGTFYYHDQASSVAPIPSGPVSVTFTENTYLTSSNPNRIPAGGSGVFELGEDSSIKFTDQNMWTADFDWGLILNGNYKYKVKGDSLILQKQAQEGIKTYEYRLKRTE